MCFKCNAFVAIRCNILPHNKVYKCKSTNSETKKKHNKQFIFRVYINLYTVENSPTHTHTHFLWFDYMRVYFGANIKKNKQNATGARLAHINFDREALDNHCYLLHHNKLTSFCTLREDIIIIIALRQYGV